MIGFPLSSTLSRSVKMMLPVLLPAPCGRSSISTENSHFLLPLTTDGRAHNGCSETIQSPSALRRTSLILPLFSRLALIGLHTKFLYADMRLNSRQLSALLYASTEPSGTTSVKLFFSTPSNAELLSIGGSTAWHSI